MNNLTVVGRLTKDSELSYMKGNGVPVLKFYVAVERKFQKDRKNKKVDFIPCESIGKHCESITQYLEKGVLVSLQGEIHFEPYTDKDGTNRTFTKMQVENINILEFKKKDAPKEKGKTFEPIHDETLPF